MLEHKILKVHKNMNNVHFRILEFISQLFDGFILLSILEFFQNLNKTLRKKCFS